MDLLNDIFVIIISAQYNSLLISVDHQILWFLPIEPVANALLVTLCASYNKYLASSCGFHQGYGILLWILPMEHLPNF